MSSNRATTISTIIILFTLAATDAFGQQIEIIVRVIDKDTKKPIKNANVVVDGTTRGTITNSLGFFKLSVVPQESKLIISHVTYRTEPITIPEGIKSFIVPLEKTVYYLSELDLHSYPNNFNEENLVPIALRPEIPRPDSMIIVESFASFPYESGVKVFLKLFGNNFQFPEKELLEKREGRILFGFTIDTNGDYKNPGCPIDTTDNLCHEFKRIISTMPRWIPAQQRGEPMEQTFALLISYGLNDHWQKKIKDLKKTK